MDVPRQNTVWMSGKMSQDGLDELVVGRNRHGGLLDPASASFRQRTMADAAPCRYGQASVWDSPENPSDVVTPTPKLSPGEHRPCSHSSFGAAMAKSRLH